MSDASNHAVEARRLLRSTHSAALATIARRLAGHPYASAVAFITDHEAHPVMLVSRLAEHTKNLEADNRASMLVLAPGSDAQAAARLTLVGGCQQVAGTEALARRYVRYVPDARQFLALDFDFYRLSMTSVRYIGGFGAIHWLSGDALVPPPNTIEQIEDEAIEHMNRDHADALRAYCRHVHQIDPCEVAMIGLDCDGIDLRADNRILRVEFPVPAYDAGHVRATLTQLARDARG